MHHTIILLSNGYLEYRFVPRFHDYRDAWEFVRTVDYSKVTMQ